MAMHACFTRVYGGAESLVDALDLGFQSTAPLAECREPTLRARELARALRQAHFVKDPGSVAILGDQLNDFASLPFAANASELTAPALSEQLTTIDVWHRTLPVVACGVAVAESALERDCQTLETDFTLREARVIGEVTGVKPESATIELARDNELRIALETGASTWLVESKDAGATWKARLVTPSERPKPPALGRELPEGTLATQRIGPPAQVFMARKVDGAVEVASYAVPSDPKAPWPEPVRSRISSTSLPSFVTTGELGTGIGSEKWFPLLARDPATGHATLLMAGGDKLFAVGFDPAKSAVLSLATGGCPPSVLASTASTLTVHVPAARTMGAFPIQLPVGFRATAHWKTASLACTTDRYAVGYLTKERAVVQTSEPKGWAFGRARVIAQTDENGTPLAVKLVGTERRLLAILLRQSIVGDLLRAEVLASSDGGLTWE